MRLSLDHLTVADATPEGLAEVAAQTGYTGICLFLHSMPVLPRMPVFDLIGDVPARRNLRRRLDDLGLSLDLAYPFTMTGRSRVEDFLPGLDAAADLGARGINVLIYERDPGRQVEKLHGLCEAAGARDLRVSVEFYPPSRIATLEEAVELVEQVAPPERLGLTLDLLHLVRSGGQVASLAALGAGRIHVAQICDGPAMIAPEKLEAEAAWDRHLPGEGVFECAGFLRSLPEGTCLSIEAPCDDKILSGMSLGARAKAAYQAVQGLNERALG